MLIETIELGEGATGWFTGRDAHASQPPVGRAGNLSHRRPHRPDDLCTARATVGAGTATDPGTWHLMQQVHGNDVGVVGATTPRGAELRAVDGMVTAETDRPLVVLAADCVPIILCAQGAIGVAHAGRMGTVAGVVAATIDAMDRLGAVPGLVTLVIGPAIRGCCYEVPAVMRDEVAAVEPAAFASTSWGTPSVDLPRAVRAQAERAGVQKVRDLGACTGCDPRWFSHRRDPGAGRHAGIITRRAQDAPASGVQPGGVT